ncbi:MAG: hypothetical protein Q8Q95_00515 [bacterium]|nr:hypothetical protein [bacterium]
MKYQKLKIIFGFLIAILIFAFLFLIFRDDNAQAGTLDDFAKCLTDKNVTMYGAAWCSHCQNQKNLFGEAFTYINYVECPNDPQKCLVAGIESYPTWLMPNKEKLAGEQKLQTLSEKTECELPKK